MAFIEANTGEKLQGSFQEWLKSGVVLCKCVVRSHKTKFKLGAQVIDKTAPHCTNACRPCSFCLRFLLS